MFRETNLVNQDAAVRCGINAFPVFLGSLNGAEIVKDRRVNGTRWIRSRARRVQASAALFFWKKHYGMAFSSN